jgi:hypothetical protein
MQLALFTPGAYIWPVHRSFEAFIASLGTPANGANLLAGSPAYPARQFTDSALHGLPPELDRRLTSLHRAIYTALLRPVAFFRREPSSFVQYFMPDMLGTAAVDLVSAFTYYFVRRPATELGVVSGLSVLRAVFFNHEAAEPGLWLHNSLKRLEDERAPARPFAIQFSAPAQAREQQLAFTLVSDRLRPAGGSGWITGSLRRHTDGLVRVQAECELDLSLDTPPALAAAAPQLEQEIRQAVGSVFGWQIREAA